MTTTDGLRDDSAYSLLGKTILESVGDSEAVYSPSPGNWGDALINFGADQFFKNLGLSFRVATRDKVLDAVSIASSPTKLTTLIVGGGGGWCQNWSSTREFVERCAPAFQKVIILPTTYELPLLKGQSNITYFSRELLPENPHAQVRFCHDMAFYIDLNISKQEPSLWRLIALRGDKERHPEARTSPSQIDISLLGNSYSSVEPFFEIVNRFQVIYTDRLHVGIAAALLGVRCVILPGNYDKARMVWKASIENSYSKVRFSAWADTDFLK
jgi:exopolysaccharide biosynthesis predicted pyruvyltransferase EpsI